MITTAEEARKLATEQRAEVSPSYQTCIEDTALYNFYATSEVDEASLHKA